MFSAGPGLAKPSENGAPFIKTEALQNNRSQIQRGGNECRCTP
jgi:hypothetical protein